MTRYPEEVAQFIKNNYKGIGPKEMATIINEKFNTNYKRSQIKNYYANHKLNSGLNGYFEKGHVPFNKGIKGVHAPGCEKGWFKKGHTPHNHRPIGSERKTKGYWYVKIQEPNVWELKHKIIWEKKYGKVEQGYVVTFLDGDTDNMDISNLELISKDESLELNKHKLRSQDPETTQTGILISKVNIAVRGKSKRLEERNTGDK